MALKYDGIELFLLVSIYIYIYNLEIDMISMCSSEAITKILIGNGH